MSYEALDYFLIMRRHCYEFLKQTAMDRPICRPHMNYFALSRHYKIQNHVAVHEHLCLEKVFLPPSAPKKVSRALLSFENFDFHCSWASFTMSALAFVG